MTTKQALTDAAEPSDAVLSALKGMQRFWGKYPAFVYAPKFREEAYAAVDAMNAVLALHRPEQAEKGCPTCVTCGQPWPDRKEQG